MSIGIKVFSRVLENVRAWLRRAGRVLEWTRRPPVRLSGRVAAVIAVGLIGGWIGLMYGGSSQAEVGPVDVSFALRPSLSGGTIVDIPPLGTLRLDSHAGPIGVDAQVNSIRPDRAQRLIEDPNAFDRFAETIGGEVRHAFVLLAVKASAAALVCAALGGFLIFRSLRRTLWSTVAAFNGLLLIGVIGVLSFNPQSVAEPKFTGILAGAPQVVGDAKTIVSRIGVYRAQLARLIGNVSRLYDVTSTLPTYEPDPSTIRVLHVSDIHLNPVAWSVIRQVTKQFKIQLIIDTGDLTDHGSKAERKFVTDIGGMKIPYVFIRGNHDSTDTEHAVAKEKNAIVLDDRLRTVGGLRIYGIGDPRFTPDKTTRGDAVDARQMFALGQAAAERMRAQHLTPDIILTHDPNEGQAFDGLSPLVMSGHTHQRSTRLLTTGTRLFVQGSTGGAGLRGLEHEQPTPIEMSVLYFNRTSHRLQGWDDIQLGGLGLTSAQIERTLEPKPDRPITPPGAQPSTLPSPTTSAEGGPG